MHPLLLAGLLAIAGARLCAQDGSVWMPITPYAQHIENTQQAARPAQARPVQQPAPARAQLQAARPVMPLPLVPAFSPALPDCEPALPAETRRPAPAPDRQSIEQIISEPGNG
ncbi:MAG: hypothetical protein NW241_21135 [Bacteroidia bacterium]|nr:hypothetical protein [Bacteroidia bacterium]